MRFAFFSTMDSQPWGGSEELWSRAAVRLLASGHEVAFNYPRWPAQPEPLKRLVAAGARPQFRLRMHCGRSLHRRSSGCRSSGCDMPSGYDRSSQTWLWPVWAITPATRKSPRLASRRAFRMPC